jgi:hypothetical protein
MRGVNMFRRFLLNTAVASALVLGMSAFSSAQQTSGATDDAKKAGTAAKDAAKDAGEATKDAGKATGKATKSAAKKTAQVTKDAAQETGTGTAKAAKTVKKKLTPNTTSATCKDGTVQSGKTKTTACIDHGGIRN